MSEHEECELSEEDCAELENDNLSQDDHDGKFNKLTVTNFFGQREEVNCVAYSIDHELLLTGSDDGRASLYVVNKNKKLMAFDAHQGPIRGATISLNTKYFSTCGEDKNVNVYITATADLLHELSGHTKSVECVQFSNNSELLCSGSWDRSAILWDIESGFCLKKFSGHKTLVQCICFSKDDTVLALGSWDYTFSLWPLNDSLELLDKGEYLSRRYKSKAKFKPCGDHIKFCLHKGNIHSLQFSNNGAYLASGGWDRVAVIWELATLKPIHEISDHGGWVQSIAWSKTDEFLATVANFDAVRLFNTIDGICIWKFDLSEIAINGLVQCSFTEADKLIVTGSDLIVESLISSTESSYDSI